MKKIKENLKQDVKSDDKSVMEAEQFSNEYKRKENLRNHAHWIFKVSLWAATFLCWCVVFVWFWNFLMPEQLRFVTEERFREIQTMLFIGLISQVIPYLQNH